MAGLGAALMYFGQAAPGIGKSFDDAERDKLEKQKTMAYLLALDKENKTKDYAQARTEKSDLEADTAKEAARGAFGRYTLANKGIAQAIAAGGADALKPGGYAGPIRPEYQGQLGKFAEKTPVQRMNEFELPYHAAADEGIKNTVEQVNKESEAVSKGNRVFGFGGIFQRKLEAVKDAFPELTPDEQYLMAAAPGTAYSLSEEGIGKAANRSAAMSGASKRATLASDIQSSEANRTAIQTSVKVQQQKVDAANAAMVAMPKKDPNGNYDMTHMTPQVATELAMAAARLVSPTGQIAEGLVKELKQNTLDENISRSLAFLGLKSAGTTQQNLKNIENFIIREGTQAEQTRNNALKGKVTDFNTQPDSGAAEIKVVNGKAYTKVDGGWQLQK